MIGRNGSVDDTDLKGGGKGNIPVVGILRKSKSSDNISSAGMFVQTLDVFVIFFLGLGIGGSDLGFGIWGWILFCCCFWG